MSRIESLRLVRDGPYSPPGEAVEIRWPWLAQYRNAWIAYQCGDRDPQVVLWAERFQGWYETQYEWLHALGSHAGRGRIVEEEA
jgi:hypothetical protein